MKKRVAILISGRGSNMSALASAAAAADFPAEIALVLSNRPEAPGLTLARDAGLPTQAIDHRFFEDRAAFDRVLDISLAQRNIDLVCLAGFMRIFTPQFIDKWRSRIINIHPSLLPSFKGTKVHEQALAAGVAISGCTVHFVTPELDAGPIIGQAAIPVRSGDTPESLAERILKAEHRLYPMALRLLCADKVRLDGGKARFSGAEPPALWFGGD